MKPLVLYCRWQGASLRLRGRNETAVWGELVLGAGNERDIQPFRYALASRLLTLSRPEGEQTVTLDEMGVVVRS